MEQELVLTPPEPLTTDKWERLMQLAIERGGSAEQFAMLVDAMLKARREDARLQYHAAMKVFKDNLPQIIKTKKVSFPTTSGGKTEYWHVELDKASEIIGEELKKVGIDHSWRPSEGANGRIVMTCVFHHRTSGHNEDVSTIGGPPDTSGAKNNVQAIGSTVSYLQRYTLLAGAGIVSEGMDNDGATPTEGMSENAITDYCIQMQDARIIGPKDDRGTLQFIFGECYEKAKTLADKDAQARFIKVYEEGKKRLANHG